MKYKCLCIAVRSIYHCVWIYRCIRLKELRVCECYNVTDSGISMVVNHCNQLRVLNLRGLRSITGMCAICEDPEPTLYFIIVWCILFLYQVHR